MPKYLLIALVVLTLVFVVTTIARRSRPVKPADTPQAAQRKHTAHDNTLDFARGLTTKQLLAAASGAPQYTFLAGSHVHRVLRERGIEAPANN